MKQINYYKIKYLFSIFLFFLFNSFAFSQDKVHTVLILKDWKPYYSLDKNGKPTGYAIELFEALAKDVGIKYKYEIYNNWGEMQSLRENSKNYIIPNTGLAKSRTNYTIYSNFTDTFQINYFKRKESFYIQSEDDLINKNIAIVASNICERLIDKNIFKTKRYKDHLVAMSALLSGDVDSVCYPKTLFENSLKSFHLEDKIVILGEPIKEIKRGLGFSLDNEHLVPKFNKALLKLKNNGKYNKLYEKWFVKDTGIKLSYEQIIVFSSILIFIILSIVFVVYFFTRRNKWLLTEKELQRKILEKTKELNFSLDRYNRALSATQEGIWDWQIDTAKVYYSPTWKTMLGYDVKEIKNEFSEWERLIHPDDFDKASQKAYSLGRGEITSYSNEFRMLCKDGTYKWILSRTKIVESNKNMKPKRIVGTHIDLTEQKEREKLILEQKEKFESIFKNSNDGIAIFDLDTKFLEFNNSYLNMLGYTEDELRQRSCIDLTPEEFREESVKALEKILVDGFIENFEKKCTTKDGHIIIVNMTANLLPDKKSIIAVSKNVTSLKLIEGQERLVSMGEMIGNIAHQWRQPLTVITMNANNIKFDNELDELKKEEIDKSMNLINENAQFLSSTIDTFRNFIKGNNEYLKISINDVLNKSLALTDASRKENYINLIEDIKEDVKILGNENELEQAFINILNNSKDILKEKDEIEERCIFVNTKKTNNLIEIEIVDSGGGAKEEIINKIFEPYFTTKHQSVGTGLGLTMVDKIIRQRHNGTIKVNNKTFTYKNKKLIGMCFNITFKIEV